MGKRGIAICRHRHADCFAAYQDERLASVYRCNALHDTAFKKKDCPFYKQKELKENESD